MMVWRPSEIYSDNVQSKKGLLMCLSYICQRSGAGMNNHPRTGLYSLLLLDVSTYWMLIRLLYHYPCFAPLRHDLYVLFGFWHPYSYGTVAVWNTFRETFIGPAFFHIFPDDKLLNRPKLVKCTTFLTWLRVSYVSFRTLLLDMIQKNRTSSLELDVDNVRSCLAGNTSKYNEYRSRVTHLCNMYVLFDFCFA